MDSCDHTTVLRSALPNYVIGADMSACKIYLAADGYGHDRYFKCIAADELGGV